MPLSLRRWKLLALTIVPLALITGCGFHLQGRNDLPRSFTNAIIVTPDPQTDFHSALRAALLAAGSRLDGPPGDAATIRILDDSATERVLTVSARNIPTAFQLSYRVQVSVDYRGQVLLPAEEFTLIREYSFDERALLAKEREREALQQALADDLVSMLMRRLAAL